jgi:hypothetical protein
MSESWFERNCEAAGPAETLVTVVVSGTAATTVAPEGATSIDDGGGLTRRAEQRVRVRRQFVRRFGLLSHDHVVPTKSCRECRVLVCKRAPAAVRR